MQFSLIELQPYIDQINDTGSILFRMGSSYTEAMRITSLVILVLELQIQPRN